MMILAHQTYRLEKDAKHGGLVCRFDGLSLAGAPLLRVTATGLAPRPDVELHTLMKVAYGERLDPTALSAGLGVVARALNDGDLGRAMIAALHLRLPELSLDGAHRLSLAEEALAKFNASEARDSHGRWTSGGGSPSGDQAQVKPRRAKSSRRPVRNGARRSGPTVAARPADQPARLIPVADFGPANDNYATRVCLAASRHCQITALQDKARTPYFAACQKAEDVCLAVLPLSRLKPDQRIGIVFPDHTVVMIDDGYATLTHLGGVRLARPLH